MSAHILVSAHSAVCLYVCMYVREFLLVWMQFLCVPATGSQFLVSTLKMLSETGTLVLKYCMKNEVYIQ